MTRTHKRLAVTGTAALLFLGVGALCVGFLVDVWHASQERTAFLAEGQQLATEANRCTDLWLKEQHQRAADTYYRLDHPGSMRGLEDLTPPPPGEDLGPFIGLWECPPKEE